MSGNSITLTDLLSEIRHCRLCEKHLPLGPRPVLRAAGSAGILIIGQAPGTRVHASGIPWDDASGKRLRSWLQVDDDTFYDEKRIAIMPMGFCYPGRGKGGDLPPRPECAPQWHGRVLSYLPGVKLVLLVGNHARQYYLPQTRTSSLAETLRQWDYRSEHFLPLVHPSPRNSRWLGNNPWFEQEVVPIISERVHGLMSAGRALTGRA